jgi:hypothetical protein
MRGSDVFYQRRVKTARGKPMERLREKTGFLENVPRCKIDPPESPKGNLG